MSRVRLPGKTVNFWEQTCVLIFYRNPQNNNTCIDLEAEDTGESFTTATIPYPAVPDPVHQVVIKDYSENEGLPELLQKAGVLGDYLGDMPAPYGYAVYELLVNPLPPLD